MLGGGQSGAHEMPYAAVYLDATTPGAPVVRVELDLQDLAQLLLLDADRDYQLTFSEYRARRTAIDQYVIARLQLVSGNDNCRLMPSDIETNVRAGVVPKSATSYDVICSLESGRGDLQVSSSLLTELDPDYRTLLEYSDGRSKSSTLLGSSATLVTLRDDGRATRLLAYVGEGIHHIMIGADHLAFLLLLLLPVARSGTFRERYLSIAGIVTAFTVAHSVTLLLAAGGFVSMQAYLVEIVIAASVVFAGLLNVIRPAHRLGWSLAYAFGLVHGFGFASVLAGLVGADGFSAANVLAFNAGVELGQLGIVAVALPLLSLFGSPERFQRQFVPAVSAGVAILGASWLWTRI
jgi:hypothetical protein